jgi:hypothetical protein
LFGFHLCYHYGLKSDDKESGSYGRGGGRVHST